MPMVVTTTTLGSAPGRGQGRGEPGSWQTPCWRRSDPAALLGEQHRLLPRGDLQLAEHGRDVVAHRPGREREAARDLGGRLAVSPRAQDVELAVGERWALVAQGVRGDLGVDVPLARG